MNCLQKSCCVKTLLSFILFIPLVANAHLISISATKPFPRNVAASSTSSATFQVTNISSKANVTVVDKSNFPASSGLSIASSTCGSLLTPGKFCTIKVSLRAPSVGKTISGALKEWAQPTADGVEYPITVTVSNSLPNITLQPVTNGGLPALREPVIAHDNGNWLIVSGSKGGFHDFDSNDFITNIYVYNPSTLQVLSASMSSLPAEVQHQLASSDPVFLQDGTTLYIIGGFYQETNLLWTTLNIITAIDIPGMINAITTAGGNPSNVNLSPYVQYRSPNTIPQSPAEFKVTGGQLGKIGSYFYLAYGQNCSGGGHSNDYCVPTQIYTNSIYKFTTNPDLSNLVIVDHVTHPDSDNSGWRRRDYNLSPLMRGNTELLFALAGPFTQGNNALVWTNGITFDANLQANDNFINQQANQYSDAFLPMYSSGKQISYVATFSGLSNVYWLTSGLSYNNATNYGNILGLISSDASGNVQEYANLIPICGGQPLATCLYSGLVANFIPIDTYYDSRGILQLDNLSQNSPTLIGYVYGGLVTTTQLIFGFPNEASNQVYAVYVTPAGNGVVNWLNITNLYPGIGGQA
jgi:hypothetical protein